MLASAGAFGDAIAMAASVRKLRRASSASYTGVDPARGSFMDGGAEIRGAGAGCYFGREEIYDNIPLFVEHKPL